MVDTHTITFFKHLKSFTGAFQDPATPTTLEDYITDINHLIESTSSGPSIENPTMVKTEALDLELIDIRWRRFNSPWCTGYFPNRQRIGLDLLIHKDPEDFCPNQLRPILLFDIEVNLNNKYLGKLSMIIAEKLGALAPEHYGIRKRNTEDTQALNT